LKNSGQIAAEIFGEVWFEAFLSAGRIDSLADEVFNSDVAIEVESSMK